MIDDGMRSFDIPFLDGNIFRQVTMSCTNYFVMSFVNFSCGMEWHPHITRSLIVWMDRSMSPMCSFVAHVCRFTGDKIFR